VSPIDLVVARQAIFRRNGEIYGYELLFRPVAADLPVIDGDLMTSTVLFSSMNIGIENLVGDKLIFCNADRGLLTGAIPIMLPPERTVIEILESVAPDEEVLQGCRQLVKAGYRMALDDFEWFPGAEKFLELASVVKLDLRLTKPDALPALIARCREYDIELVAEKVETAEEVELSMQLGFDYLQGYALARPRVVPGKALDTSHLTRVRLAASMLSDEFDLDELERIIRTEPGMTYQLLNLAAVGARDGLRRPVKSIRDALILIGSVRMQSWLALLLLRPASIGGSDELANALYRARMCETLVHGQSAAQSALGFTAGILSSFENLLGIPAAEIVNTLPLDDDLREAAFGEISPVARIVRDVIEYQGGHTSQVRRSGISDLDFDLASMKALTWAVEATAEIDQPEGIGAA
jgi:EAL and modified HD-GYP domain-containing signal transduction protein